jgi:hypothetical protein
MKSNMPTKTNSLRAPPLVGPACHTHVRRAACARCFPSSSRFRNATTDTGETYVWNVLDFFFRMTLTKECFKWLFAIIYIKDIVVILPLSPYGKTLRDRGACAPFLLLLLRTPTWGECDTSIHIYSLVEFAHEIVLILFRHFSLG